MRFTYSGCLYYLYAHPRIVKDPDDMYLAVPDTLKDDRLRAAAITDSVGEWIVEALLLPTLRMPKHSLTLVLDGDPIPEATTAAFDVVQRDAVWQTTLVISYERGLLPQPSWMRRRIKTGYMYESFPSAVKNLSKTSLLVRCNFDPGEAYDVEAVVERNGGKSAEEWKQAWAEHKVQEFQTEEPLPPWHVLKWQRVLP